MGKNPFDARRNVKLSDPLSTPCQPSEHTADRADPMLTPQRLLAPTHHLNV